MFDFDAVIDSGTYDDFKECVFAVVWLEPPVRIVRRLKAMWTLEHGQDLQAMYGIHAEQVLAKALRSAARAERRRRRR